MSYLIDVSESVREGASPQVPSPPLPHIHAHTRRSRFTMEKMSRKTRQIIVLLDFGSSGFKLKLGHCTKQDTLPLVPLESRSMVTVRKGVGGGG